MKKVFILLVSLFMMMAASVSAVAQEIIITLHPGTNWISYPNAEAMDIASALGSFTPAQGDIIISQDAYATYNNGYWRGGLTHFMPGWGYMYFSARSEVVDFSFAQPFSNIVATTTPTDITVTSAVSGGTVTLLEGTHVFQRGVCWGTAPSPNIDGDHTTEGTGIGCFSSTLDGLNSNTTYFVRAYVVSDYGLAYGNEVSFTTEAGGIGDDHAYVDLGLPSGLLWATCNVGADTPEDYGDYFAWGETQPKDTYNWYTYQYCNGSDNTFTKYCSNSSYGYNGFTDNLTTLLPEDDAAAANWGSGWRMPTKMEWRELFNNTTVTLTTQNGVNGHLFTASNGNSLFLPTTGCRFYGTLFYGGSCGFYWSSSLYTDPDKAWYFYFDSGNYGVYVETRNYGLPVRPVRVGLQN